MNTMFRYFVIAVLGLSVNVMGMDRPAQINTTSKSKKVTDANIIGHVIDKKTGKHVSGITIIIKGTSYGTTTDTSGHYFLRNLKPGKEVIQMQGLGYLSQEKTVQIKAGETIEVNFEAIEDLMNLDEVVVTSNRQATLRRYSPTLVSVIDDKTFQTANAVNLAQGLTFQPGIRVEDNCQNCGFNQVRINGLDGRFSQILIDGRPIFSALAGVYGLEQIPTNMIDRVEIVRGGGSALYGSSAIAGVINIITKEPITNSFSYHQNLTLTGGTKPDNTFGFNASIISADSRMGAMVFGQSRNREPWDANGDGFSEIGKINTRALGTHIYIRPNELSRLTAEIHSIQESRRGGDSFDLPDHAASVSESIRHSIYSGNIKYDLFSPDTKHHLQSYLSGQIIDRQSYYGGIGDEALQELKAGTAKEYGENYGVTKGRTFMGGLQYTYDLDHLLLMPAQVLLGTEYNYDDLHDVMPLRQWSKNSKQIPLYPPVKQTIHTWSQIAQVEWKQDNLSLLLGGRLDENSSIQKAIFSPRVTLRYNPFNQVNLRVAYAKGFRAPQVFDEDLHVGVVNGEAQRVKNSPDLRPEYSHSVTMSSDLYFKIGEAQTNLLIEGFYTKLIGAFNSEKDSAQPYEDFEYFTRINGSDANIYGINMEGKLAWKTITLQGGLTLAKSQWENPQEWGVRSLLIKGEDEAQPKEINTTNDNGPQQLNEFQRVKSGDTYDYTDVSMTSKEFLRTPSIYGYMTLNYNPTSTLNIIMTVNYTGQMHIGHEIEVGRGAAQIDRALQTSGKRPDTRTGAINENAPRWDRLEMSPSFLDMGLKVSYDINIFSSSMLQLYIGVNNLLNDYQRDFDSFGFRASSYIYGPIQPRSYYAGLRLSM